MSFIVKNVRDHAVKVGTTSFAPHQQLSFQTLDAAVIGDQVAKDIGDAMDRGDLTIHDATLTPVERHSLAELFTPNFKTGDKAIDG